MSLVATDITPITVISQSNGEIVEQVQAEPPLPSLTLDEDTFALAVVEYGGNLRKAFLSVWPDLSNPAARARALVSRPEVAYRIKDLTGAVTEQALISLGSHMVELADIRDLAKEQGALKVALDAEVQRGKVAGFYVGKSDAAPPARKPGENENPMVVIQISTPHDSRI